MFRLPSYFGFRHTSTSLSMTNGLNVVPSEVEGRAWQSDNKT